MLALDKMMVCFYGLILGAIGIISGVLQFDVIPQTTIDAYVQAIPFYGTIYFSIFVSAATTLIGFSLINIAFSRRDTKKVIEFRTDKGQVSIVLSAIEEFVRKTTLSMPNVKDIKTKVSAKGKGLKVICRLSLSSDSNVTNLADNVQKDVEEKILAMVGVDIPLAVNINIVKLSVNANSPANIEVVDEAKTDEEQFEEAFKGIEY